MIDKNTKIDFDNLKYLKFGSDRQRQAYSILTRNQIFSKLKKFNPILAGTIPINIDIENSDLDIICYFEDNQEFQKLIKENFGTERNFKINLKHRENTIYVIANFFLDSFEIEIFGQNVPSKQQYAYRHLIVEYNLLRKYGEEFRQKIIELKRQGYKTEPAFALALGLTGDPYTELLKFEINDTSPSG
jgi:hypothetical protein